MNTKSKKVFSIILVIAIMLSSIFIPGMPTNIFAEAQQENENFKNLETEIALSPNDSSEEIVKSTTDSMVEVKVRVEGFSETLYNDQISYDFNDETRPLDLLKAAVGEENIEGKGSSLMGYYITGILGENQSQNQGWCYYVKFKDGEIILPSVGVDQFEGLTDVNGESNTDELVFYMCSYSGANLATKIPKVTVENDGAVFIIKVFNNEVGNKPINNVNIKIGNESLYKTDENGEVSVTLNKSGTYNVEISKDNDFPQIVRQHLVLESEGSNTNELENIINELKEMFKNKTDLNAMEVMAYNSLMNDENDYFKTFKINESDNAAAYAENIMGSLATGQDSSFYVNSLVNAQNEDGIFVIGSNDVDSVTALSDSITALDMAKAEYNVEEAVNALINFSKDGYYKDVTTTAYALRALLKHTDIDGVEELITSSIQYLGIHQLGSGGYDYYDMGNSPYSTGPVVQALVMAEEDLSSDDWKKGQRTLVDALIACKVEGKGFEFVEGKGYGYDDVAATQFAFAALSDVYCGISMYDRFVLETPNTEKDYDEILENAIDGIRDYLTSMETRTDSNFKTHPAFYRPIETLGLNVTSNDIDEDVEDIAEKFVLNESEGTLPYAMNIIGLLSSGQNASKYVDLLKNGQLEDGSFKIGIAEQTEWAVIALDMAGADYNKDKAVKYIMTDNAGKSSVAILAVAVTALANHKDVEGVEDFINNKLSIIQSKQLENGGFESVDGFGEDSQAISYVISALVANGIDPLSDSNWIKNEKNVLDALLTFKKSNCFIYNNDYGELFYKDEATEQAFIALTDLKNRKSSYQNVQDAVSYQGIIKDSLSKLRNYLTTTEKRKNASLQDIDVYYSWQEALAINHSSNNLNSDYIDIQGKLKIEDGENVLSYAESIMGIIASGQVLSNVETDYVSKLVSLQNEAGEFIEEGKKSNVYKQSYSIIALDMAHAEYNVENAVNALLNMLKGNNFESIDETAWALIALSKHKDIDKVTDKINSAIEYLKAEQSDTGGFDMMGCGDTPQYTAVVIQALMANDIDPLSSEWKKVEGNLVSSMIHDQMEDGTFRACKLLGNNVDIPSTERAFAALADLYEGESMYKDVEPQLDPSDIIKNIIKEVKDYYKNDQHYNYLQAMALNIIGVDKSKIASRLELRKDEEDRIIIVYDNDVEMIAKDIMGIIAAGENPSDYNGKNKVKELQDAQDDNGEFKIEDDFSISSQAYAIIALDMAAGNYDVDKAVRNLITKYDDSIKKDIYTVSSTIIALSNHKNINGVEDKINACIEDLKSMQLETGGFSYDNGDNSLASEVSEYDAIAIQALIAAGINPLGEDFTKDGRTIVDAMMSFKVDDHFIYDSYKSSYEDYNDKATGMVLAALVDLDNNKSMYRELSINDMQDTEAPVIELKGSEKVEVTLGKTYEDLGVLVTDNVDKELQVQITYTKNGQQVENIDINELGSYIIHYNVSDNAGNAAVEVTRTVVVVESLRTQVERAIDEGTDWLLGQFNSESHWQSVAIARSGKNVPNSYLEYINNNLPEKNAGQYGKFILGTLASGGNPEDINGHNLYEELIELNLKTDTNQYTLPFGVLALDAVNYEISADAGFTRTDLVNNLLTGIEADGGFALSGDFGFNDGACFNMTALGKYYNQNYSQEVTNVINKTLEKISLVQDSNGGFGGNSNSSAQVLMAITANKKDPTSEEFTKNGNNVIDYILSLQNEDGSFNWQCDNAGSIMLSTEQIIYALEQYLYYLDEKGSIYDFVNNPIEKPTEDNLFEIVRVGNEAFSNGDDARIKIQATNNNDEALEATVIAALYDNNGKMIKYGYVSRNINSKEEVEMSVGFNIPEEGIYKIRAFVWDNIEDMKVLSNNIIIINIEQ